MNKKQIEGDIGEKIALEYLKSKGYTIVSKNFRCKQGEIDIIAEDSDNIIFIEVKTRTSTKFGEAKEAVNTEKQKHIYKAAGYFLYKNNLESRFVRIDVIEVYILKNGVKINHIKQAI